MATIAPATPTKASTNKFLHKETPTKTPIRTPRRSPRKSPYTRKSPSKRSNPLPNMSEKLSTAPESHPTDNSNQVESSRPRTIEELNLWIYGTKDGVDGFTTDASVYLRYYENAEDDDEDEEEVDDDFDWKKFDKEIIERLAEKARSEQKKS